MFNATCLIKTDIDTVNKCMGQNPYNPETFLQNFASRLTSFDDPLLNIYPTSEIAGNIEDEDVILGLREPQKLIEWAKTMKERTQCMAMAEFSAALQKHKAEGIDITKPMLRQVIKEEPTYKKGNYIATARIAQHYPTAVKNAGIVLQNLLKEGMPGLEDTDERNLWLCKNCRTFSTVQEAISFLESLKCE